MIVWVSVVQNRLLLTVTDVSTTCVVVIFSVEVSCITPVVGIKLWLLITLCSKHFRTSSSRKVRREQKKRNDGGGERRKRLSANPTILKNCVRARTQLLIGAALVMLIK